MRSNWKRSFIMVIVQSIVGLKMANKDKSSITDFSGAFEMSDEEAERIKKNLRRAWKSWKPKPL